MGASMNISSSKLIEIWLYLKELTEDISSISIGVWANKEIPLRGTKDKILVNESTCLEKPSDRQRNRTISWICSFDATKFGLVINSSICVMQKLCPNQKKN